MFAHELGRIEEGVSLLKAGAAVEYFQPILASGNVKAAISLLEEGVPIENIEAILASMPRPRRFGNLHERMAALPPIDIGSGPSEAQRVASGAPGVPGTPGAQAAAIVAAYNKAIDRPTPASSRESLR